MGYRCQELADFFFEQCARLGSNVKLLVARLEQCVNGRTVFNNRIDRDDELDAFFAAFDCTIVFRLRDSPGGDVVRLIAVRWIFGGSDTALVVRRPGQLLFAKPSPEEPAANTLANLTAADHGFQVIELVNFQAAENHQLRFQAIAHWPFEFTGNILAQRHPLHRGRNNGAGSIEAASRQRLMDVDGQQSSLQPDWQM